MAAAGAGGMWVEGALALVAPKEVLQVLAVAAVVQAGRGGTALEDS